MTITYPRTFPDWFRGMTKSPFQLAYLQEQDPTGTGEQLVLDLGPTLWGCTYRSGILSQDKMAEMEAWLDSLENGGRQFYAYDFRRPFGLAYPNGFAGLTRAAGGTFDGTCTLDTVADNNKVLSLSGLPAGFILSPFDNCAFSYAAGGSQALHRNMARVVADGDGKADIEVRPHVRPGWAEGATVDLSKPSCLMRVVPDSYSPDTQDRGRGYISFSAKQTLKFDPT